ncbi:MAG: hypothetical protein HZA66_15510 [Rhodopseudomonas palustris]|uniref:Inner membrane protein n=1 Tax=Rhodopseudomonas palustris TaxID=1076 RepID=A0A933VVE2_RHOPL|nr:hypothetical protein [Rhodopseudomonas palustris]
MVENRPGHEDTQHGGDHQAQPAPDGLPGADPEHTETPAEPVAHRAAEPVPEDVHNDEPAEHRHPVEIDAEPLPESASPYPETRFAAASPAADEPPPRPAAAEPRRPGVAAMMLPPVLAVAIAAAVVVGAAKTGLLPEFLSSTSVSAPQGDAAALDALKARIADLEARPAARAGAVADATALDALAARIASLEARPSQTGSDSAAPSTGTPDAALTGRVEALEKSVATLRDELATLRSQSEQLAGTVKDIKLATSEPAAAETAATASSEKADRPAADPAAALAAINARLSELEHAAKAATEAAPQAPLPPAAADDAPLRRLVAATLLDLTVKQGAPFAPILKAAQPLAPEPAALKPLEPFAATGVPSAATLGRELIALLPKLLSADDPANTTNFIDRFQANAERLVRIQRSDATAGIDRTAIVGRLTAAAQRSDLAEARRELKALAPADRAPVQSWIDRSEARDQALAASQSFATAALAALKPSP